MAYSGLCSILIALLLLGIRVTRGEETPREEKDKEDDNYHHFVTRPDIQAPKYEVHIYDNATIAPGYWFVAPYDNINKLKRGHPWEGPYIYDGHGELIWAGTPAMDYYMVNDFKVSRYNNTDMLTGIMFRDNAGLFLNNRYELVKSVNWTAKWEHANMHEFHLVRDGTRALTLTRNRWLNLTVEESRTVGFDGNCSVSADGFKEVDITVDPPRILFEWIGIEHLPLKEAVVNRSPEKIKEACEKDWDVHHLNSVDKFADGDYLLSSKETNTIYKISHIDGSIVWRLGGKQSDFKITNKVFFEDQHMPRIINETETHLTLSLFANTSPKRSRGILISVNYEDKSVKLLQEAHDLLGVKNERLTVSSRGSTQLLPNGNMFTCWADWSRVSEHDADGKMLMFSYLKRNYMVKHKNKIATYRAYKFPWVGHPTEPPAVYSAAFPSGTDGTKFITRIFVSWNGATEVARWKFYESNEDGTVLKLIEESKWKGFETDIRYEGYAEYVVLEALDSSDESIGRSPVVKTIQPAGGSPLTLDQGATVLNCGPNDVAEESNFDSDWDDAPYRFDSDTIDPRPVASHPMEETFDSWDPISALAGFSACAGMWIGMEIWRRRSSQRQKGPKYEPVESKDRELLFGGEEEEEEEEEGDDVELKEQKR